MSRVATLPVSKDSPGRNPGHRPRRRFPWLRLRYMAVLCVCGWAAYHFFHVQYPQLHELSTKRADLQQKLDAANKQHADLVKQSQEFQNDQYIARYASEHYNLILPGQVAFDVKH